MPGKTRTLLAPPKPADKAAQADALLDGRYRIDRLLGEGGMGAVYLASHVGLGRQVAIKFLHADLISREDVVGRFYREAQAAAAIRHKNIIEVFDVGRPNHVACGRLHICQRGCQPRVRSQDRRHHRLLGR